MRASYLRNHPTRPMAHLAAALAPYQVRALALRLGIELSSTRLPSYRSFTMAQVSYLKAHYQDLPPAHFAERWQVTISQVYDLARRCGIKRRAPNQEPVWRERRQVT